MRFVIFGLTVSSSWANGHATTWRGLLKALDRDGHATTFFERDVSYYAAERDLPRPDFCQLVLYEDWPAVLPRARQALADADVAIVTSYCADGLAACRLVLGQAGPVRVFYDIDTPVTLAELSAHGVATAAGARYLTPDLIPDFDLYLSFAGGPLLREIETVWGARRAAPLYCSVDPEVHAPTEPRADLRCSLGYLGTYSPDRQAALDRLLIEPARRASAKRFVVVGSPYPADIDWPPNVELHPHLPPREHAAFYCANRLTLNVTREAMVQVGYAPSVRLFEAASCGTPILSDWWPGLDELFAPGEEILIARTTDDAVAALELGDAELARIARAARERTLAEHTAAFRARELVRACESAHSGVPAPMPLA
ncbi:MAG: glycosyltransferase [Chloroflexi bacterium]|nr:glycosyltransferase [Chloroflexota bacterium]